MNIHLASLWCLDDFNEIDELHYRHLGIEPGRRRRLEGWRLVIVKPNERAFEIAGLTSTADQTFARSGRSRRFAKDYERRVQTSETMIDIAAVS